MDFRFTNEYKLSKVDEIVDYILGPRLWVPEDDYPDFSGWVNKVWRELKKQQKRAVIAFHKKQIVGVSIYQEHKDQEDFLEIKNLTVRPDKRGRYVASFLLRNTEVEGVREFDSTHVVCDAKADNFEIKNFLLKHRYDVDDRKDLYKLGAGEDIVYKKRLDFARQVSKRDIFNF